MNKTFKPFYYSSVSYIYIYIYIYRVSQEECARLRKGVPYVKVYRYNPKHLCPKLNGYGDNGQRKVWSSCGSTHCTCQLTILSISVLVSYDGNSAHAKRSPRLSTCRMASRIGVPRMQVWRTLHEEDLYPYMIKGYNIWNQATTAYGFVPLDKSSSRTVKRHFIQ